MALIIVEKATECTHGVVGDYGMAANHALPLHHLKEHNYEV